MKKLLFIALVAGLVTACGSNDNQDNINNGADSTNTAPVTPDTSMMNTDTGSRMNPNASQDSLRHN